MSSRESARARTRLKKRKPQFKRHEHFKHRKLKDTWRKAKGRFSSIRLRRKGKGAMPNIGYRTPKPVRGLTHSGYREVIVHNASDVGRIDPKTESALIAHGVGKRKKAEILEAATKAGVTVSNVRRLG